MPDNVLDLCIERNNQNFWNNRLNGKEYFIKTLEN